VKGFQATSRQVDEPLILILHLLITPYIQAVTEGIIYCFRSTVGYESWYKECL